MVDPHHSNVATVYLVPSQGSAEGRLQGSQVLQCTHALKPGHTQKCYPTTKPCLFWLGPYGEWKRVSAANVASAHCALAFFMFMAMKSLSGSAEAGAWLQADSEERSSEGRGAAKAVHQG